MRADRRTAPGARAPRAVAGVLCAAVLVCALLGAGPAAAVSPPDQLVTSLTSLTSLPVADAQTVDYSSGPYADRLCPTTPASGVACSLGRSLLATTQGAGHRDRAVEADATCERQAGLWVCFDVRSFLVQRGGTTYGDTFLSPDGQRDLGADLVAHESEHVRQWRLFGPDFSLMYLAEGVDPCGNYFEQQAGLAAGGYSCG
ncbi:hypothetical protein SANBI_002809 [Sanguibacter sp. 4.1]|uniref:DUF4157 domain-containing protein n=1 Tax=Sanguibacter biliveldensis TaxID=3030830 RepID=A0AAF0Z308_9MICO|nr:hypothetical protein [Sanguibacter sp. 4.1]WPF81510.1 hypothetical protein SANBI_002809 [Sanguibacter sp. 4.1]